MSSVAATVVMICTFVPVVSSGVQRSYQMAHFKKPWLLLRTVCAPQLVPPLVVLRYTKSAAVFVKNE